jgi:hypothetical protein
MPDRDAVLNRAIHEVSVILADALVRPLFPAPASNREPSCDCWLKT